MSRFTSNAFTVGVLLIAIYAQLPNGVQPHQKHVRMLSSRHTHRLDELAPMPQITEDENALAYSQVTPVFPPQQYQTNVIPPRRYESHTIEVWNGSHRETISVSLPVKAAPRGVQQFTARSQEPYKIADSLLNQPNINKIVSRYSRVSDVVADDQPVNTPMMHKIFKRPGVSDSFAQEIDQALSTIPLNQVNALNRKGYRVILSKKLTDVVPTARNQQVRGYEASSTWNSVYGMFNRTNKKVVMAELAERTYYGKTGYAPLADRRRRIGIVRHEFGHAVDQYLGNFSHLPKFQAAFMRDVQTLNQSEKETLSYFLQPGNAGTEETFAELYACLNGEGCDAGQDQVLRNHFGDLISMIQGRVSTIRG